MSDRYGFNLKFQGPNGIDSDPRKVVKTGVIDPVAVEDFFKHGYFHDCDHYFKGVKLSPPAWTPTYDKIEIELEDAVDRFYQIWVKIMSDISEGNVGCQLSGGYDSRLIAATLAKLNGRINTLTFGCIGCDDITIAERVCNAIGAVHNTYTINPYNWFNHRIRGVYETAGAVNIFHIRFMDCLQMQKQLFEVNVSGFLGDVIAGNSYRQGRHPCNETEGFQTRFRKFTNYGEVLQSKVYKVAQPFIHEDLVDFCLNLPDDVRTNLYPRLFTKYFPEVVDIPRQHSCIDDYDSYFKSGSGQVEYILFDKKKMYPKYIDETLVKEWWDTKNIEMIGRAVTFELFLQQYYEGRYLPVDSSIDFDVKKRLHEIDDYSRNHWVANNMHESIYDATRPWHKERVKTIAKLCEGKTMLDVASADGAITELIRRKNHPKRMVAYEGGIAAIENGMKLHPYIEWIQGMVEDMPFGVDEFEFVHAGEIIEHITDVEKFVLNISKIASSGALITTPSIPVNDPQHIAVYTPEALKELCLRHFDECEVEIQKRTLFALCRHKKKARRSLPVEDITLQPKAQPINPEPVVAHTINPRKIVFVTPLLLSRVGGDVTQNNNILKILSNSGYAIDVLHLGDKCYCNLDNVKFYEHGNIASIESSLRKRWVSEGYAYAVTRSADFVMMASRIVPSDRLYGYIYGEYFKHVQIHKAWKACNKIIVQGEGSLIEVKKLGLDASKAVPISVCIDEDSFHRPFVVGHIGQLFGYQDVRIAYHAVKEVRKEYPCVTMLVVGDELRKVFLNNDTREAMSLLSSTDWVTWIPKLKHTSMSTVLASCDCMVAQYKARPDNKFSDNLVSTKALECALMSVPVIVNDTYNYRTVFGKDYELYYDSLGDVVNLIKRLVSDEKFYNRVSKNMSECIDKFSMQNVTKQWNGVFPDCK